VGATFLMRIFAWGPRGSTTSFSGDLHKLLHTTSNLVVGPECHKSSRLHKVHVLYSRNRSSCCASASKRHEEGWNDDDQRSTIALASSRVDGMGEPNSPVAPARPIIYNIFRPLVITVSNRICPLTYLTRDPCTVRCNVVTRIDNYE